MKTNPNRPPISAILFYSVDDVARMLRVSTWKVRDMIEAGEVEARKFGPLYRIPARPFHEQYGTPFESA